MSSKSVSARGRAGHDVEHAVTSGQSPLANWYLAYDPPSLQSTQAYAEPIQQINMPAIPLVAVNVVADPGPETEMQTSWGAFINQGISIYVPLVHLIV